MTRFYIDTEFIEDGKTIDLISIGIVREDGKELYLQSCEFDPDKASDWVRDNVFSSLLVCPRLSGNVRGLYAHRDEGGQCTFTKPARGVTGLRGVKMSGHLIGDHTDCPWRSRIQMRQDILSFINNIPDLPSFYGDYCAYDYVALCQLFGTMMDWPHNWPMYFHDLRQQAHFTNIVDISLRVPMMGTEHNALDDARWVKKAWEFLS